MSQPLPPILLVDDERNMRLSLETIMSDEGYETVSSASAEEALKLLSQKQFFMVITDARLGGMSGYEFLNDIKKGRPNLPVLMITAYATPKLAVEAIKAGAVDYLAKPFEPEELLHAVERCAERHRLLMENAELKAKSHRVPVLDEIIGENSKIEEIRQLIRQVAPTNATVLVLGESGTGKELIAGSLHSLSHRRDKNYIRINCAAIPENLLESELFGHEKGAFTGALKQKFGRLEEADGGTVFLDEIGDMSRPLQAKLLRFLEDGTFTRVGGNNELRVDVRLIAATNRDIVEAIQTNEFREDLFHRLNVVQFFPPPLRERGHDITLLAHHFLKHFNITMGKSVAGLSKAAESQILEHHWPGNVRELRNVLERAVILEKTNQITPASLPHFQVETRLKKDTHGTLSHGHSLDETLMNYERELISNVYDLNNGNLSRTAEHLKISRHALRYRMQRLQMLDDGKSSEGTTH